MVLLPKGNTETRRIGLIEVLWKVMKVIIDSWSKTAVAFKDALHVFLVSRGMGTAIMELNIA